MLWAAAATLIATVVAVVGPARAASAHAALVQTAPTNDVVLPDPPSEVLLRFSEPVTTSLGSVRIFAPDGARADSGTVEARDGRHTVAAGLSKDLVHGTYVVAWRVVSADSHPVSGTFSFSFSHRSAAFAASAQGGTGGWVLDVARFAALGGLVILLGSSVFHMLACVGDRRLSWVGWMLGLAGSVAVLLVQGPYGAGLPLTSALDPALLRDVLGTRFGAAAAIRIAVVAAGVPPVLSRRVFLALVGVALVVTTSLTGHAGTGGAVALAADGAHLAAACCWLGGLAVLVVAGDGVPAAALRRWSTAAAVYVGVLVVTGTIGAWREVAGPRELVGTGYGRLVAGKVAVLTVMLALAWVARRHVRRAEPRLGRVVAVEAALGAGVLALSAVLVGTPPAGGARLVTRTAVVTGVLKVQVDVDPARSGINQLHVYYTGEGSKAVDVAAVRARVFRGSETVALDVPHKSLGHYEDLRVPLPGDGTWRLELVTRTSDTDAHTTVFDIPIR